MGGADDGAAGVYRPSGLIAEQRGVLRYTGATGVAARMPPLLYLRFTTRELARGFNYHLRVLTLDVVSAVVYADVIG